ncbi:MAG: hypothetical protein HKN47_04465 [Pirellulaceae bacterium]|nr:hypothetical protein [Pirellulaceae bacterium]
MLIIAQVGIGGGAAVVIGIIIVVVVPVVYTAAWFGLPVILRLFWDLIRRRDLMTELKADQDMNGRLFTKRDEPGRRTTQDRR